MKSCARGDSPSGSPESLGSFLIDILDPVSTGSCYDASPSLRHAHCSRDVGSRVWMRSSHDDDRGESVGVPGRRHKPVESPAKGAAGPEADLGSCPRLALPALAASPRDGRRECIRHTGCRSQHAYTRCRMRRRSQPVRDARSYQFCNPEPSTGGGCVPSRNSTAIFSARPQGRQKPPYRQSDGQRTTRRIGALSSPLLTVPWSVVEVDSEDGRTEDGPSSSLRIVW